MELCTYFRCKRAKPFEKHLDELKENATDYKQHSFEEIDGDNIVLRGAVFHKVSWSQEPEWLGLIDSIAGQNLRTDMNGPFHSAIILIEVLGVTYAITFGTAHTLAKRLSIEHKFGKIVVGNGKVSDEVRGIKANVPGSYGKTRIERRGRGGPTHILEVPRSATALGSVAAKIILINEHIAEGGLGIRTAAAVDVTQLREIIAQLELWYSGGKQSDALLASYDRIEEVLDGELTNILQELMVGELDNLGSPYFSLALDSDEMWETTEHSYRLPRKSPVPIGLSTVEIVAALRTAKQSGVPPDKVKMVSKVAGREHDSLLIHNLSFELVQNPNEPTYIYEGGAWYEASASWTKSIAGGIQDLAAKKTTVAAALSLPEFTKLKYKHEDGYLNKVKDIMGSKASLCHKEIPPPGHPKLELCDLLVDGKYLIFAKQGSDYAACSSVGTQASQCALALCDDSSFATWAKNAIFAPNNWTLDISGGRNDLVFVVLLLVGTRRKDIPYKLTVRAQDALWQFHREVSRLGFNATVLGV